MNSIRPRLTLALALALSLLSHSARSAEQPEDWLCVQIYNPVLDSNTYWPERVETDKSAMPELAVTQTVNRLFKAGYDEAAIQTLVDEAFVEVPNDQQAAARQLVFDGVFKKIRNKRERYLDGVLRHGQGQLALADELEVLFNELDAVESGEVTLDAEALDDLRVRIKWSERLLYERNAQLNRFCEAPVELTEQLSAVSRALQAGA